MSKIDKYNLCLNSFDQTQEVVVKSDENLWAFLNEFFDNTLTQPENSPNISLSGILKPKKQNNAQKAGVMSQGFYEFYDSGKIVHIKKKEGDKKTNLDRPREKIYNGYEAVNCVFCGEFSSNKELIRQLGPMYGPFNYKTNNKKVYTHEMCALMTPGVFLNKNNKMQNLTCEITRSLQESCVICTKKGAGIKCFAKGCDKNFHYSCA